MLDKVKRIFSGSDSLTHFTSSTLRKIVADALKALNCDTTWQEENGAQIASYQYQNGFFQLYIGDGAYHVSMIYYHVAEISSEHIDYVRFALNHLNLRLEGVRFTYTIDEEEHLINIHIMTELFVSEQLAKDILQISMQRFFEAQQILHGMIEEHKKEKVNAPDYDPEVEMMENKRKTYLLRQQEILHQDIYVEPLNPHCAAPNVIEWLAQAYGLEDCVPSQLTIVTEGVEHITERKAIEAYELHQLLIENNQFKRKTANLTLCFFHPTYPDRRRYITLFAESVDYTEEALYYRITSTLAPLSPEDDEDLATFDRMPQTISLLLGYSLTSEKILNDEFIYRWKEISQKVSSGQIGSLSTEEKFMLDILSPDLARLMYRGKQCFLNKRYHEALRFLETAFKYLLREERNYIENNKEGFWDLCYMLGFSLVEIQQYERALYYLAYTLEANDLHYKKEYVNCIANMKDFRAVGVIKGMLYEIEEAIGEIEEGDEIYEILVNHQAFLYRRLAYVLIDNKEYDDAETLLLKLKDSPHSVAFAESELDYLYSLKKQERNTNDSTANDNDEATE